MSIWFEQNPNQLSPDVEDFCRKKKREQWQRKVSVVPLLDVVKIINSSCVFLFIFFVVVGFVVSVIFVVFVVVVFVVAREDAAFHYPSDDRQPIMVLL